MLTLYTPVYISSGYPSSYGSQYTNMAQSTSEGTQSQKEP